MELCAGKACKEFPVGPAVLRVTAAVGAHVGDCPPCESHVLGGVNCVRGYTEGGLGAARHWVQATAESEWPIMDNVHGALAGRDAQCA